MKRYRRRRWRNKHHIRPRSRGGNNSVSNLLLLDGNFHIQWHKLFGNRTIEEVIKLLKRIQRAKNKQGENNGEM